MFLAVEIPELGAARLEPFVRQRLAAKRMTWAQLASSAALSKDTLWKAAKLSRRMRPETLTKMDIALDWPIGTCAHIIDGGTPPQEAIYHAKVDARLQKIEMRLTELTQMFGQLNHQLNAWADANA